MTEFSNIVLEQGTRCSEVQDDECYSSATHGGGELDLFVMRGPKRLGFEIK
jgi:hypothetical protein